MLRILLFVILVFASGVVISQDGLVRIENNGTQYTLDNNNVTSDFGRREGNLSKWHRGVDLSLTGIEDRGYTILAIGDGQIATLDLEGSYKIIAIQGSNGDPNYGYGHIFRDGEGTYVLGQFLKVNIPALERWVIMYHPGQTDSYILTDAENLTNVSFTYDHDDDGPLPEITYSVSTQQARFSICCKGA